MTRSKKKNKTPRSGRSKSLSYKAKQTEIQNRTQSIRSCVDKFDKVIKNPLTTESREVLADLVLTAIADYDILESLIEAKDIDLERRVKGIKQSYEALKETEVTTAGSLKSSSSVSIVKSTIESAELDIELENRRTQEGYEMQLKELEAQIAALKFKKETSILESRRKKLETRQQFLQNYEIDAREEIADALERSDVAKSQPLKQAASKHVQIVPGSKHHVSTSQCSSDVEILADTIAKAMKASRYAPPEPPMFTGDPLEFIDWEVSFNSLIDSTGISQGEKIHYLKRYVSGTAKEAISGYFLLTTSAAYNKAMKVLKDRFGSPYVVAQAFRSKLAQWPKLRNNDALGVQSFADFLAQCVSAKEQIPSLSVLDDTSQTLSIMSKLPEWLMNRWKRQVVECRKSTGGYPTFEKFANFVRDESDILNDPVLSQLGNTHYSAATQPRNVEMKTKSRVLSTAVKTNQACAVCKKDNHKVTECYVLANQEPELRKKFVNENRLCFSCLEPGLQSKECKNKAKCKKCKKAHPSSMHIDNFKSNTDDNKDSNIVTSHEKDVAVQEVKLPVQQQPENISSSVSATATCRDSHSKLNQSMSSMIVPVWLSSSNKPDDEILVYALLDTMSDTTFVTTSAVKQLNTSGKSTSLKLTTMTTNDMNLTCKRYNDLMIRGYKSADRINVPEAYSRDSIPLDRTHIPTSNVAKLWPHLQKIAHEIPELPYCEIGLLIGYDTSKALVPLRSIVGKNDCDPYAVETPLGWSIVGNVGSKRSKTHRLCNRVCTLKNEYSIDDQRKSLTFVSQVEQPHPSAIIELLLQDFRDSNRAGTATMSQDDKRFLKVLNDGIQQQTDKYYSMPLPFKVRPDLPDNRFMAEKRLNLLKKKLLQDKSYCKDYFSFMNKVIEANDAEIVTTPANNSKQRWYVPHFGVYHPKKNKIRVVFDCAAKYNETSLDDHLLQGPDFMNSLVGILHRFRKGEIAIMCDIERMFHRFKVHEADRDYLRFLWFSNETMNEIVEYRMTVHIFGAKSSPACATYGLRTLASQNSNPDSEYDILARDFILNDFYVDDGLLSVDSTEQAIGIVKSAIDICAKGNVRLHKFICNSKVVMSAIPESEQAETLKDLEFNTDMPIERALGVQWCIEHDQFQFRISISKNPDTRRGVLSTIASIFDPLGFLSPYILVGKQILQEMCKDNFGWDDPLSERLLPRWLAWKHSLIDLQQVKIDRCVKPTNFGKIVSTELHHFSDASTVGYGQCSYLRLVNSKGQVHCTLVTGKSRVAPIKSITIPRLELQAAVLSAKMAQLVKEELGLSCLDRETFWTDTKVVLGYIQNESRRFHVYVANRVQQIKDLSSANQWYYVSTEHNPSDNASRGLLVEKLLKSNWFTGPDFLNDNERLSSMLATSSTFTVIAGDPEVKATCHTTSAVERTLNRSMADRLTVYSTLNQAIRAIAMLRRYANSKTQNGKQLHTHTSSTLNIEQLQQAKITIIYWSQLDSFKEELNSLNKDRVVAKDSPLAKLNPFLDHDGLIRVGGRLKNSDLPLDEVHPIILSKKCHIAKLVIDACHRSTKHQGKGMTIAEVKSAGYWIIGCSSAVASHIYSCVICRRQRRPTEVQQMANLPDVRCKVAPPFTYVGCDCFGPFIVREGRKEIKRYGVLFTCMASRAVHIELVDDMTTDAFINALRCLIAIRGPIRQLRSDRGSNFVGARNELIKGLSPGSSKLSQFAHSNNFDFVFNTPNASHMGGVWERQIRTIRSVLNPMLAMHKARLDTTTIRTFLYEVMAIVNCRPIGTCDNSDDTNPVPLSPNQLLTMKSKVVLPPPGKFDNHEVYSRKRWRQVQSLANTFWSRWKIQYLQSLQSRSKWSVKQPNITVGDIVILREDNCHRNYWPLARVVETIKSNDGFVRTVKLLIADQNLNKQGKRTLPVSYLERPIHKVVMILKSEQ